MRRRRRLASHRGGSIHWPAQPSRATGESRQAAVAAFFRPHVLPRAASRRAGSLSPPLQTAGADLRRLVRSGLVNRPLLLALALLEHGLRDGDLWSHGKAAPPSARAATALGDALCLSQRQRAHTCSRRGSGGAVGARAARRAAEAARGALCATPPAHPRRLPCTPPAQPGAGAGQGDSDHFLS